MKIVITQKKKDLYLKRVYEEMENRGIPREKISKVIDKTGFLDALNECTEVQFHYSVEATVDDILLTAACS